MKNSLKNLIWAIIGIIVAGVIFYLVSSSPDNASDPKKKLMLIQYSDSPLSEMSLEGIKDGLAGIGMKEGVDYDLDVQNAQGDLSTLNIIIEMIQNKKPDLLFVSSTPTLQAVAKKVKDIPVVFTVVADPVDAGVGKSFTDHQSNITGISTLGDYEGMVRWLKALKPDVKRIGTIFSPGESNSVKNKNDLTKYATADGLEVLVSPVTSATEITDATLSLLSQGTEVVCQVIDNLTSASISSIIKVCRDRNVPFFGFVSDQAEMGAVLVVSRDYHQAGVDAVMLAKKVFDGEDISKIPFEFVSRTDILFNPDLASKFDMKASEDLLNQKGVVIIKK
jgi:ABC-type uncharacterized transport system substrate-binding protein